MARCTYVSAGPPGSADILTSIIEATLGQAIIRELGSDPYVRADAVRASPWRARPAPIGFDEVVRERETKNGPGERRGILWVKLVRGPVPRA
jgi:hypothetical protein